MKKNKRERENKGCFENKEKEKKNGDKKKCIVYYFYLIDNLELFIDVWYMYVWCMLVFFYIESCFSFNVFLFMFITFVYDLFRCVHDAFN